MQLCWFTLKPNGANVVELTFMTHAMPHKAELLMIRATRSAPRVFRSVWTLSMNPSSVRVNPAQVDGEASRLGVGHLFLVHQ
jgi:hypothetical protein